MHIARLHRSRALVTTLVAVLAAAGLVVASPAPDARAASSSDFDPGYIIADSVFYDFGTMTQGQIQSFLNSQGANCVAGQMPCLKDYTQTTTSWAAETGLCLGYTGAQESAATIISNVATSCGVNPRVLLVLLQKESSLVTRTQPTFSSYQTATGFGCPDTATCNTNYYGFFNQVYRAARQYKLYALHPTQYGYQAGRSNYILYNPNTACGGSSVYIGNQATAGLYIYTPYQPNAAALANLYGTGDSCSAYGNRNFWRLFTDWFGDPQAGSFLLRTAADPDVYLVVGSTKYPLTWNTFTSLSPLGPVGYVSQAYLDRMTTGPLMPGVVVDPRDGSVYMLDAGNKYWMPTCAMVADYGASCSSLVALTGPQVDAFPTAGTVRNVVHTDSGKVFAVSSGTKREVLDDQSAANAGLGTDTVTLTEAALGSLPYGAPYVRNDVVVRSRNSGAEWLMVSGSKAALPDAIGTGTPFSTLVAGALDDASLAQLGSTQTISGVFTDAAGRYVISADGLVPFSDASTFAAAPTPLTSGVKSALTVLPAGSGSMFVLDATSGTVYDVAANTRRPFLAWPDLTLVANTGAPRLVKFPAGFTAGTTLGTPIVRPGSLVKSPTSAVVYVVTDLSTLAPLETFAVSNALGTYGVQTVPASTIQAYVQTAAASPVVMCGANQYVGVGGTLQPRRPAMPDPAPLPITPLADPACRALPTASGATALTDPVFVMTANDGTVYSLDNQSKHPIASWATLIRLNNGHPNPTIITIGSPALSKIPTGSVIQ